MWFWFQAFLEIAELSVLPFILWKYTEKISGRKFRGSFFIASFLATTFWYISGVLLHNNFGGGLWVSIWEGVWIFLAPVFLYAYLRLTWKIRSDLLLFLSLIAFQTIETFEDFLQILITSFLGDDGYSQISYILSKVVMVTMIYYTFNINRLWKFDIRYYIENEKEFRGFIRRSIIGLILTQALFAISYVFGETERYDSFGSVLLTVCFLSFFIIMLLLKSNREDYEKQEELERQKKNQENLQSYTDKIVSLYNEVRGFRHDFAGMVTSLRLSIDSGNLEEIKAIHREVLETANSHLGSESFTVFELNNIGDNALRSVLMDKAIKAEELGLNLTLDIKDYISRLPVQMLDLVRITNIIFDNALEGAYESYSKELVISVIDLPDRYVIVAKNSRKREELRYEDVYSVGYSTKGRHRGLGLPTVKRIIDSYENMLLDTEISKDFFTQVISIEKEGVI